MANTPFVPMRAERPEISSLLFEEVIRVVRCSNLTVRSVRMDDVSPKVTAELELATMQSNSPVHIRGNLEVEGRFKFSQGHVIDLVGLPPHIKCLVKDCENHRDQGEFVGDLCYSCYEHLTTGNVGPTKSILRKIKDAELFVLKGHDGKIVTQGQFNALVAENAALKEKARTPVNYERTHEQTAKDINKALDAAGEKRIRAATRTLTLFNALDMLQTAWGIIANANGGNWTKAEPDWKEAAARWRDEYHAFLKSGR